MTAFPRRQAWRRCALLCGAIALSVVPASAQGGPPAGVGRRTAITVSGLPFAAPVISPADFDAGFTILGTMRFTVDATSNNPAFSPRVATVNVRCFAPCPATGTLAATRLQWRRGDLGTWNALTTTMALVESRTMAFNGANDPWTNTVQFRYLLNWATTGPAPATQFQLEVQLVVTAP